MVESLTDNQDIHVQLMMALPDFSHRPFGNGFSAHNREEEVRFLSVGPF